MRRAISLAMVIFGLMTMVAGIWKLFPPMNNTFFPGHAVPAFIFGALMITHVILNLKPAIKYFRGLHWGWVPIGLGCAAVIWVAILPKIIF